jgi:hypothetical protein
VPVSDFIFNCHDFSLGLGLIGLLFIGEVDLFLDFMEKLLQRLRSVGAVTKTTFGRRIVNCAILPTGSIAFAGAENGYSKSTPAFASPWSRSTALFEIQIGICTFVPALEGDVGMKNP